MADSSIRAVLEAIGLAEAAGEYLDFDELEKTMPPDALERGPREVARLVDSYGLAWSGLDPELSPRLAEAGHQYLAMEQPVDDAALAFLPPPHRRPART